jgi:hypothetical protein
MQLATFQYTRGKWSVEPLPELDSENTLALVFGAPEFYDTPEPIQDLARAYPKARLMGCSSSGEIYDELIYDHSLSVGVVQFEHTRLAAAEAPVAHIRESFAAGQQIARSLQQPDLRGVLVLSDGLQINGSELVRGLNDTLPENVVVTGGLAGDGDRFERTWVLKDGKPQRGWVSAVGFYGDRIKIGHGSRGGWDIFGPERRITRSEGSVLYELDSKPALEVYKDYLGEMAKELPASGLLFPLALRADRADDKSVVRTILAVDEATHSLTFAGDVPTGHLAQLMKANFERLVEGAANAARMTTGTLGQPGSEVLMIAISCVGRRLVLGERTEEELEATLDIVGHQTRQIGFYSYGEISPFATGHCDLHNQTMTLTAISEV